MWECGIGERLGCVKMLGLAAVAAMALMAFVGAGSASVSAKVC